MRTVVVGSRSSRVRQVAVEYRVEVVSPLRNLTRPRQELTSLDLAHSDQPPVEDLICLSQ